jgi:hypothetical protein
MSFYTFRCVGFRPDRDHRTTTRDAFDAIASTTHRKGVMTRSRRLWTPAILAGRLTGGGAPFTWG